VRLVFGKGVLAFGWRNPGDLSVLEGEVDGAADPAPWNQKGKVFRRQQSEENEGSAHRI